MDVPSDLDRLIEAFGDPENPDPLHPDLVPFLHESSDFGHILQHPLVYHVPYFPLIARMANREYETKREALERAEKECNWNTYVFLHQRPWRLDAFTDIALKLTNKDYWKLLSDIWTDTENSWQNHEEWEQLFSSSRTQRRYLMDADERAHLRSLPDEFTIYRGFHVRGAEKGLAWTTSREKAIWFARRLNDEPKLATAKVAKKDVVAYFSGRGEEEIIVLPKDVRDLRIAEVP